VNILNIYKKCELSPNLQDNRTESCSTKLFDTEQMIFSDIEVTSKEITPELVGLTREKLKEFEV